MADLLNLKNVFFCHYFFYFAPFSLPLLSAFTHHLLWVIIFQPRRVRFTLPSPEDADVVDAAVSPTDVHLKTRASHQQLLDSIARQTATPYRHEDDDDVAAPEVETLVTSSPGVRTRVHPTGRYIRGTLSPTSSVAPPPTPSPGSLHLVRAARDGDDGELKELLKRAVLAGVAEADLNATDNSGRVSFKKVFNLVLSGLLLTCLTFE